MRASRLAVVATLAMLTAGTLYVRIMSADPLAGCLSRYPGMCMAVKRQACAYESGCVAAAELDCQARAAARCPKIVTVRP